MIQMARFLGVHDTMRALTVSVTVFSASFTLLIGLAPNPARATIVYEGSTRSLESYSYTCFGFVCPDPITRTSIVAEADLNRFTVRRDLFGHESDLNAETLTASGFATGISDYLDDGNVDRSANASSRFTTRFRVSEDGLYRVRIGLFQDESTSANVRIEQTFRVPSGGTLTGPFRYYNEAGVIEEVLPFRADNVYELFATATASGAFSNLASRETARYEIELSAIPEPGTGLLLALGLFGLSRRR